MRFFDAFRLKGYAIDYYPCGDRDENVILGGSDVEKVLIVEGTTLNVLWDD
jgi:hypothetical protein